MRPTDLPTLWLRTFPVDGGDELRIWEDPRGTLAGGNGATCWDSALAFATAVSSSGDDDNSLASTTDWRGQRVLELGSGCGLVALALACRGANVVATERAIALPLLEKNLEANAALVERREARAAKLQHRDHLARGEALRQRRQRVDLGRQRGDANGDGWRRADGDDGRRRAANRLRQGVRGGAAEPRRA